MKNTKVCPKCGSKGIITVPGISGAGGAGNNIPLGVTVFSAIKVTRYLCFDCGFSEEWIDKPEDRMKIKKKYRKGKE